jgi:hypothetical protein
LKTRIDYFLLSSGWKPVDAEIVSSNASDHRPIRLTVGAKPTTAPATTTSATR